VWAVGSVTAGSLPVINALERDRQRTGQAGRSRSHLPRGRGHHPCTSCAAPVDDASDRDRGDQRVVLWRTARVKSKASSARIGMISNLRAATAMLLLTRCHPNVNCNDFPEKIVCVCNKLFTVARKYSSFVERLSLYCNLSCVCFVVRWSSTDIHIAYCMTAARERLLLPLSQKGGPFGHGN
jgi:hypothetical protein